MGDIRPPLNYFANGSQATLESLELARLNQAANLCKELRQLLEEWVECEVDARIARRLREWRVAEILRAPATESENRKVAPAAQLELPLLPPPLVRPHAAGESADQCSSAATPVLWLAPTADPPASPCDAAHELRVARGNNGARLRSRIGADPCPALLQEDAPEPAEGQSADIPSVLGSRPPKLSEADCRPGESQSRPIVVAEGVARRVMVRYKKTQLAIVSSSRDSRKSSRTAFGKLPPSAAPDSARTPHRSFALLQIDPENLARVASA